MMNLFEFICRSFSLADEVPALFIVKETPEGLHQFTIEYREAERTMNLQYVSPDGEKEESFSYNTEGCYTHPSEWDSATLVGKLREFEKQTGLDFTDTDWRWDYSTRQMMEDKIEKLAKALKFQKEDS